MAWKNCVDSDVPDSMTGASIRNDAMTRSTAQIFAMNRLLLGIRIAHRSVQHSETRRSNSPAILSSHKTRRIPRGFSPERRRWAQPSPTGSGHRTRREPDTGRKLAALTRVNGVALVRVGSAPAEGTWLISGGDG